MVHNPMELLLEVFHMHLADRAVELERGFVEVIE